MIIGLMSAIAPELAIFRDLMTDARDEHAAGVTFTMGTLDGHRVVVVGSGMGKVNAAIVSTLLIDRFCCDAVVFSGVAGGLDPSLAIGDVVIADRVIQHDVGEIKEQRLIRSQAGHVPSINPTEQLGYSSDELADRVRQRLCGYAVPGRIVYGTVLSGDQFVSCDASRARLFSELGGRAIEMEGGSLAQVCEAFGVPWLVIRALSDLAGGDAVLDFTGFVNEASATSAGIVRRLLPVLDDVTAHEHSERRVTRRSARGE